MGGGPWFWQRIPVQRRKRIVLFALAAITVGLTLWAARSVLGLYMMLAWSWPIFWLRWSVPSNVASNGSHG